ncbi:hypothetical protein HU200_018089 [Digitaria exilis]|uniref:Uncharacterized protein n=1 Tax=Digitaria exilis TaxID=1010633 RepID=A0A835F5S0_9POAL|nr:hypothetical protein HU200_018089 [Digitaria exilis]
MSPSGRNLSAIHLLVVVLLITMAAGGTYTRRSDPRLNNHPIDISIIPTGSQSAGHCRLAQRAAEPASQAASTSCRSAGRVARLGRVPTNSSTCLRNCSSGYH